MSRLILLITTALILQYTHAQEFETTNKYRVANRMDTKQQEYATAVFDVVIANAPSHKAATLSILDLDFFEDINISVLSKPNLIGITEILKVAINYNSCCTHSETYYFMVTPANAFIALPHVDNHYCENTSSEVQYIFPSQAYGKAGLILKTEMNYTNTHNVKDTHILQRFAWNDNDFNTNETIAYSGIDNN